MVSSVNRGLKRADMCSLRGQNARCPSASWGVQRDSYHQLVSQLLSPTRFSVRVSNRRSSFQSMKRHDTNLDCTFDSLQRFSHTSSSTCRISRVSSPRFPPCHFQSPSSGPPMVFICCDSGSMHSTVSALLGMQYLVA